nr:arylesterase [Vibrio navarrensis]
MAKFVTRRTKNLRERRTSDQRQYFRRHHRQRFGAPARLVNHPLPDWVLIELGANDGLRGFPPKTIAANLSRMIQITKAAGAKPVLMQIRVPPNYGKRYSQAFFDLYPTLAEHQQVPLLPFFLEQVITKPEWMMQDGLHPTADAQPWIAEFVAEMFSQHL